MCKLYGMLYDDHKANHIFSATNILLLASYEQTLRSSINVYPQSTCTGLDRVFLLSVQLQSILTIAMESMICYLYIATKEITVM